MADTVRLEDSSGSPARVGFDLYKHLQYVLSDKGTPQEILLAHLKLYADCRNVAIGGSARITP